MVVTKQIDAGCSQLGIELSQSQLQQCTDLCDLLIRWNKKINLTSITKPSEVVTKHILDSLSLVSHMRGHIQEDGVLDVGTGAGFPGLPLAIALPEVTFTLLDSNRKKITFIQHAAAKLGLNNVHATHVRIQDLVSERPFSIITARAFADVNDLLKWLPDVYDSHTQILAMKGKMPDVELESLRNSLLASQWEVKSIDNLMVPGLDAERCVIKLIPKEKL